MKAVILAGGKGTRGRPYTDYFPKAMTPINGKPLIDYIVGYLKSFRFINEIIIISDYTGLGGQIKNYFNDHHNRAKITFVQDSQMGTGGDLLHIEKNLKNETEFILWFVDNLCAVDLKKMKDTFKEKNSTVCIATRTERKEETGFAIVNDGIITEFQEKPRVVLPMAECLGIYICSTEIINRIKEKREQREINLSFDVLQSLSKERKISAYNIGNIDWLDAESPVILDRNRTTVKRIIKQMGL